MGRLSSDSGGAARFAVCAALVCLWPVFTGAAMGAGKGKGAGGPDAGSGGTVELGGIGALDVSYFDTSAVGGGGVKSLDDVDWTATPSHTGLFENFDFALGVGEWQSGGPSSDFAVQADGNITLPETGTWTLEIDANDGAAVWVNGVQIAVKDGRGAGTASGAVSLAAGTYPFRLRYYDHMGAQYLYLRWEGPGISGQQTTPPGAFDGTITTGGGGGSGALTAEWLTDTSGATNVTDLSFAEPDQTTNVDDVDWPSSDDPMLDGGPTDSFGVRIRGMLDVPESGEWTFALGSDESAVLYIDGAEVVSDVTSHSFRDRDGDIELQAGLVRFEVRMLERTGDHGLVVSWQGPSDGSASVIPAASFSAWQPLQMSAWNEAGRDRALIVRLKRKAVRQGLLDERSAAYGDIDTLAEALALFGTDRVETALAD